MRLRDDHTKRVFAGGGFANWSPDGKELVCSCGRGLAIWVISANGHSARRLTANLRVDTGRSWSPDGRLIAYGRKCRDVTIDSTACDIAIMDRNGGNKRIVDAGTQFLAGASLVWASPHTLLVPTVQASGIVSVDVTTGAQAAFYSKPGDLYGSSNLQRFVVLAIGYNTNRLALLDASGRVLAHAKVRISWAAEHDVFVRG